MKRPNYSSKHAKSQKLTDVNTQDPDLGLNNISLRDWFAGQALSGILASDRHNKYFENFSKNRDMQGYERAAHAYIIADAMLRFRTE